ncbi:MAG: hypothetical protein NT049_10840, partial [Planctomycetota bacterium]|nr:hypothetical protein [Planctomycetota bacterium]
GPSSRISRCDSHEKNIGSRMPVTSPFMQNALVARTDEKFQQNPHRGYMGAGSCGEAVTVQILRLNGNVNLGNLRPLGFSGSRFPVP